MLSALAVVRSWRPRTRPTGAGRARRCPGCLRVMRDQVGGPGVEGDEAAVRRDRRAAGDAAPGPEMPFPCLPALDTLTRLVVPRFRSRTKMSWVPFVSMRRQVGGPDAKATKRPSAEIDGMPGRRWPASRRWTRSRARSCPCCRSRTKTSRSSFVSPATRLVGGGAEGDEAAVGGDRRVRTALVRLLPGAATRSRASSCRFCGRARRRRPRRSCRAPRGWRPRMEGDEAAVGGDRRGAESPFPCLAGAGHAHALRRARLAVTNEDVSPRLVSPATRLEA